MPFKSGVVDKVFVKKLATPDNFGNNYRYSMCFGEKPNDTWYSCGGSEDNPKFTVKVDGKWVQLQDGSEIEFRFKQNGDFLNVSRGDIEVISMGEAQEPSYANGGKTPYSGPKKDENYQTRIGFGNAVNVAEIMLHEDAKPNEIMDFAKNEVFGPCAELREKMMAKYGKERQATDIGAKLGDAFKHAALHQETVPAMVAWAAKWMELQISYENQLVEELKAPKVEEVAGDDIAF